MTKMLFSDLDGTLIQSNAPGVYSVDMSNSNAEAIRKMKENGIELCLATGRDPLQTEDILKRIGFSSSPYIACNGAVVHYDGITELRTIPVDRSRDIINTFYQTMDKNVVRFMGVNNQSHYVGDYLDDFFCNYLMFHRTYENLNLHDYMISRPNLQFQKLIFTVLNRDDSQKCYKLLMENYGQYFEIWRPNPVTVEIMNKGVNKGAAIGWLLRNSDGITTDNIAVIGDGYNDIPMLEQTKYSFALENSPDSVKAVSNYIISEFRECVDILLKENSQGKQVKGAVL